MSDPRPPRWDQFGPKAAQVVRMLRFGTISDQFGHSWKVSWVSKCAVSLRIYVISQALYEFKRLRQHSSSSASDNELTGKWGDWLP